MSFRGLLKLLHKDTQLGEAGARRDNRFPMRYCRGKGCGVLPELSIGLHDRNWSVAGPFLKGEDGIDAQAETCSFQSRVVPAQTLRIR
jgi:hypothetical protein